MNKLISLSLIILIVSLTSCKKCDPSNSTAGMVIEDAIVRVIGYESGENFITDPTEYKKPIEVSFDGGVNYKPVDFLQYSVFSLTTTATCSSGYDRNVVMNKKDTTVNYTVTITECTTCQNNSTINNWVLTKIVPSFYTANYNIKRRK